MYVLSREPFAALTIAILASLLFSKPAFADGEVVFDENEETENEFNENYAEEFNNSEEEKPSTESFLEHLDEFRPSQAETKSATAIRKSLIGKVFEAACRRSFPDELLAKGALSELSDANKRVLSLKFERSSYEFKADRVIHSRISFHDRNSDGSCEDQERILTYSETRFRYWIATKKYWTDGPDPEEERPNYGFLIMFFRSAILIEETIVKGREPLAKLYYSAIGWPEGVSLFTPDENGTPTRTEEAPWEGPPTFEDEVYDIATPLLDGKDLAILDGIDEQTYQAL